MTSATMLKTKLPEGYMFWNVSSLGSKPNWKIVKKPETWGAPVAPGNFGLVRAW